ncbi:MULTISPECIES: ABC transporter ATP-binding protein [Halocynthiibacter]|uniref:ABC transporter ATP-binding protein n=1 Tax=Halocynthiibacter halioticoli TaxID=2986804 RepID=A0AAE3IYV3_9RHOB|nr:MULTISPECIES: ABC transporter ATP-binding protein [Halocynthiibacter]MCV6823448.1 ABC transporter ATP-binding protein [Halocynthiibacter halioticoli]MCW4056449.1 ABC transporter ATP-binding protein [Halocynthiibacter sp. SDUM655004]
MSDPLLSVHGLSKRFGALQASNDITLDVRSGEIHALIGPNGAGKSTLIQQICGALRPDTGEVWFDGQNVTPLSVAERARMGLGRTFQISSLAMEDTVLQNAVLGALGGHGAPFRFFRPVLKDAALVARAEEALARVDMLKFADKRTADLSHGQRRQLEIAVALTLQPKLFVMDEPMAGLGASGTKDLTPILSALRHDAPILLVEHDMDAVFALADRISVLVYGKVIATGTVDEIRADAAVREAYLGEDA